MDPRFAIDVTIALARAARQRSTVGPTHPAWDLRYEALVGAMRSLRVRLSPLPMEEQRRVWDRLPVPTGLLRRVRVDDRTIGGVACKVVEPRAHAGAPETLLFFHGGAYHFGSFASHAELVAGLALASGMRVVFPEYRLAPEHPFPAAIEDAFATFRAVAADGGPVVVGGDSAGGGLALAVCVRARDEGVTAPCGAALLSPFVDHVDLEAHPERARTDWLDSAWGKSLSAAYLAGGAADHAWASPGRADLAGLPPLLVQVGDAEILYDQIVRFVERARAAGVDLTLDVEAAGVHSYQMFAALVPSSAAAIERCARFVQRVAARARPTP